MNFCKSFIGLNKALSTVSDSASKQSDQIAGNNKCSYIYLLSFEINFNISFPALNASLASNIATVSGQATQIACN